MEVDRTTALTYYLRFLAGNPDGDAAVRALVLGALTPLSVWSAAVYATARTGSLEIVGTHGLVDELTAGLRTVPVGMPMPVCDAYTTMRPIALTAAELLDRYPILQTEPRLHGDTAIPTETGGVVFAPILTSGVVIGVLAVVQEQRTAWAPNDWQYLDGVIAATAMWLNNQREILVDRWRRSAPPPQRDVHISERQREVLAQIGQDRTNREIARSLGYSIPTIKKDLQQLMKLLGTSDRRTTAGRAREIGLLPERRGVAVPLGGVAD